MSKNDLYFMKKAFLEAKKAFNKNEVPIGAVLVKDGQIVSRGYNLCETKQNATFHAEMVCINKASAKIKNFRLSDCVLYTTLEPCLMCAGALLLSRIKKIVYAASDLRHGAIESIYKVFENPHPIHTPIVQKGPLAEESSALLKEFFKIQRRKKNES